MNEENWINILETGLLPEDGTDVIAYSKGDGVEYKAYYGIYENESRWQRNGRCNMEDVTHWMPRLVGPV